jgi:hypothetical protein
MVINNVLTEIPFPGNIIPQTQQNPIGVTYVNAYPAANIGPVVCSTLLSDLPSPERHCASL